MSPPPPPSAPAFVGTTAAPATVARKVTGASTLTPLPASVALPLTAPNGSAARAPASAPSPRTAPNATPCGMGHGGDASAPGGKGGTAIVLFRTDLRVTDHPALAHALEEAGVVIPVFCFDPRHFGRTAHGFEKTGRHRTRFLIDCVADLRAALRARGSDLVVRIAEPEVVVPQLVRQTGARLVVLHSEVSVEERDVERALEKALPRSVEMKSLWAGTLYERDDMPFELCDVPDIYSTFREQLEVCPIREPLRAPDEVPRLPRHVDVGDVPSLRDLGLGEIGGVGMRAGGVDGSGMSARGGEREALARMATYVTDASCCSGAGGGDATPCANSGADFSCRISPWLALGCLSPRTIFEQARRARNGESFTRCSTYFELVWRDFFRCITAKYADRYAKKGGGVARRGMAAAARV